MNNIHHHHHQFILRQKMNIHYFKQVATITEGCQRSPTRLNELAAHYENQNITTYNTCAKPTKQKQKKKKH